jgi:NAD(P)H dehydrogenase (quinone)
MFAIIGANGNAGAAAARELRRRGLAVRAVLRDQSKAPAFEALGCSVAIADILDRAALRAAIEGAEGVQAICPVAPKADRPLLKMRDYAEAIADVLAVTRPARVVAISDFGAEIGSGVGITLAFHFLEARLREAHPAPILLRSAEHMQNWARVLRPAVETGVLPSFHHPLTKMFPMVSAEDVGRVAADLLSSVQSPHAPRIVYVEGPRRYTPLAVAETFSRAFHREIVARQIPRADWIALLTRGGLNTGYADLVAELYDAHNAGRIEIERGATDIRRGTTDFENLPMFAKSPIAPVCPNERLGAV